MEGENNKYKKGHCCCVITFHDFLGKVGKMTGDISD